MFAAIPSSGLNTMPVRMRTARTPSSAARKAPASHEAAPCAQLSVSAGVASVTTSSESHKP